MLDQLFIEEVGSNDSFEATVRERTISEPAKKVIKETVPFSNKIYDFTQINGEIYWEERKLEYIFEIIADSAEELEEKKLKFKNWIMLVQEKKLYDPFIKDYHFIATFNDIKFDDSEFEKTTATVSFFAYPYMISNIKKEYSLTLVAGGQITATVTNNSSHKVTPTIQTSTNITISRDNATYSIPAGTIESEDFEIPAGDTVLTISNTSSTAAEVVCSFHEEVL